MSVAQIFSDFFMQFPVYSFLFLRTLKPIIDIILRNWFLSGAPRDIRVVFFARRVPAQRNWSDDWLAVSDRISMEPGKKRHDASNYRAASSIFISAGTLKSRHFFPPDTRRIRAHSSSARPYNSVLNCLSLHIIHTIPLGHPPDNNVSQNMKNDGYYGNKKLFMLFLFSR